MSKMGTVLRVKRRNSIQPEDMLILCKRPKLADDDDDEAACSQLVPTVAKFAGTLKDPEENVLQHLAKTLKKEDAKASYKQPPAVNFLAQRRIQAQKSSAENRYKVVSCHRSLDTSNIEEFEDKVVTLVDIEDSVSLTANQNAATTVILLKEEDEDNNSNFVYDVYYVDDNSMDECVSIRAFNDEEIVPETYTEDGVQSDHDSEDSNAESYYQNSYPDTESDSDSNEILDDDYIRRHVGEIVSYTECHSSSGDEYEDYDDEDDAYPLDMKDVELHGYAYARYKQRMKPLVYGNSANNMNIEDEDTDCSHDSDEETLQNLVCNTFINPRNS